MKKSKAVPLILIGTLGLLTGCSSNDDDVEDVMVRQNQYASVQDCKKDWGDDEKDCRPHSSGSGYVGPRYIWSHGGGYPMAINSDGTTRQLANSYLAKPGTASMATGSTIAPVTIGSNTAAASVGRAAGVSVSRGGFGGIGGGHASAGGGGHGGGGGGSAGG